jgi:hypothetical protein
MARPPQNALDWAPGACWANAAYLETGMSFSAMERKFIEGRYPERPAGGYAQRNLPAEFANGTTAMLWSNRRHQAFRSAVEASYPSLRGIYESIAWDELLLAAGRKPRSALDATRIASEVFSLLQPRHIEWQNECELLLTAEGILQTLRIPHLDALGLLLMQRRLRRDLPSHPFFGMWVQYWYQASVKRLPFLVVSEDMFVRAVELAIPESAPIKEPPWDLNAEQGAQLASMAFEAMLRKIADPRLHLPWFKRRDAHDRQGSTN